MRNRTLTCPCLIALSLMLVLAGAPVFPTALGQQRLIRVRDASGKETPLIEKVVVVSNKATLAKTPSEAGEPIEPWAIFFRIGNDDGSNTTVNGRLRVGDAQGRPVGWIGQADLRKWNTRFILDPIEPQKDRAFEVQVTGGGSARQNATPEGKRRYALITTTPQKDQGDDTEFPVVVYAGNVQGLGQQGTLARQRNDLKDVKLEIMFVIESSDFMFNKYDDGPALLDHLKNSIRGLIAEISRDESMRQAVRLGFCEYKDTVPNAAFTSRITCDLTDDLDSFSRGLDAMQASKLKDDWPDDVLAGLHDAVTSRMWSPNSVKHIILLGNTSCQLRLRGQPKPFESGRDSPIERILARGNNNGFNSTGLSISQLIARGRPQGGADSRARTTRMFHALQFGKDELTEVSRRLNKDPSEVRKVVSELSDLLEQASVNEIESLDEETFRLVLAVWSLSVADHQRRLAIQQYQEIARNNGEVEGVFMAVDPGPQQIEQAVRRLAEKIRETFAILEKVREGEGLPSGGMNGNEIAQPLFTLVGAAAEKFKESPVIEGTATVRDQRGREVAHKKVMVSEDELRRLKSTLDSLFTKFKSKTNKADRQDVGSILENVKEILAETGAGQEFGPDVKLKDVITDLPLRTAALETTSADLAVMTSEAFREWLDKIESAMFRIEDILTNQQEWLVLSDRAVNDRFTFLRLSELP